MHFFMTVPVFLIGYSDQASSFLKDAAEAFEEMGIVSWFDKTRAILNKL
jgi:hypothetical protein